MKRFPVEKIITYSDGTVTLIGPKGRLEIQRLDDDFTWIYHMDVDLLHNCEAIHECDVSEINFKLNGISAIGSKDWENEDLDNNKQLNCAVSDTISYTISNPDKIEIINGVVKLKPKQNANTEQITYSTDKPYVQTG